MGCSTSKQNIKTENKNLNSKNSLDKNIKSNNNLSKQELKKDYNEINISMNNNGNNSINVSNGLKNLGNTCYINATLQCLLKIEPLNDYFINDIHLTDTNQKNVNSTISNYYSELIKIYYTNTDKVIKFTDFYKFLINNYQNVHEGEQEDSHEFLVFLLDSIHEELNRAYKDPKALTNKSDGIYSKNDFKTKQIKELELASKESWKNYLNINKSIIVDIFQGQTKDTIICGECKILKNNFESIMYFSLPINENNKNQNLYDCFKNYSNEEKMEKADKYYCEKCKKKTNSVKTTNFWKFPPIMIVHFKRFKYTNNGCEKLTNYIDFPLENMNLQGYSKSYQRDKPIYNLFGILNHNGCIDYGHYYSYTFNKSNNKWYYFDDSNFGEITKKKLITKNAYLLFYFKNSISKIKKQTLSQPQNWPYELSKKNLILQNIVIEEKDKRKSIRDLENKIK